jgi:hypothetical protein
VTVCSPAVHVCPKNVEENAYDIVFNVSGAPTGSDGPAGMTSAGDDSLTGSAR